MDLVDGARRIVTDRIQLRYGFADIACQALPHRARQCVNRGAKQKGQRHKPPDQGLAGRRLCAEIEIDLD